MDVTPGFEAFETVHADGRAQVVWTRLSADLETPVSAYLKLAEGRADTFVLESVQGGAVRGRYSFIGREPDVIWRCDGTQAQVNARALDDRTAFAPCPVAPDDPIASLRALVERSHIDLPDDLPPMAAGLVGYLGYDAVRLIERIPDANPDVLGVPDGLFVRPTLMAVFDTILDTITLITPVFPDADPADARAAYDAALSRLERGVDDLARPLGYGARGLGRPKDVPEPRSNIGRAGYHAIVEKAKDYIRAGDIFQVVPSQRMTLPFNLPPVALYRALRRLNPSPFLFFLDFGSHAVIGSSPEILVRVRDGVVTIRPIAGTRPRGKTPAEDAALAEELLADAKERAEHLMLLDLGRNDVGRVAEIGSVTVTEQFVIEYYSHVMHIVSNVEGRLKDGVDAIDALMAGFPAGTVSGAPKVRAMEIIDELEPERRGIYGGCIGYFGAGGEMDSCIALRTAVVKDGTLYVQAGGGVVADSDPEAEYQETMNKAGAILRAAVEASRYAPGANDGDD
jgi:anthranilate synthase component 1